jgi:formate hydrogenlyase subunit 3/multisubunit Na+/H+ antiporter MnhD subunit
MAALLYLLASVAGLAGAGVGLAGMLGATWTLRVDGLVPLGGLELAMDPLAGLFLALVGGSTAAASLYAVSGAGQGHGETGAYLAFVGAMGVVPLAANAMTFLVAWEIMSGGTTPTHAARRGCTR